MTCGILALSSGIEPKSPALVAQSPKPWATREALKSVA